MPKKKSVKKAAQDFHHRADAIVKFLETAPQKPSDEHCSWLYEYAIIRLYREFESMIVQGLVGAINKDTATLSQKTGVQFPKHLTKDVCEFIVTGGGYFDFKSRDDLAKQLAKYVPKDHYLLKTIKKAKYKQPLERLGPLRNLAAHDSAVARTGAKRAVGQKKMGSAGSWLKTQDRFQTLAKKLQELATEIKDAAPF